MRFLARPQFDPAPLEAFRASLRAWLVQLAAVLIEHFEPALRQPHVPACVRNALAAAKRQVDADLREAARDLRMLLVAHAFIRMAPAPTAVFTLRPLSVARRMPRNSTLRRFTSIDSLKHLHTGALSERAARLRDMLDDIEPLILEVLAHMTRMFTQPRLPGILVALTDAALVSHATGVCAHADTS